MTLRLLVLLAPLRLFSAQNAFPFSACRKNQMYYLFIFLYFRKVKVVLTLDSRAMENIFVGRQKSKSGGESVRITYIYIHTRLLFPPQRGFSGTIMLAEIDHNTVNYVPYSLRTVSGFFNFPRIINKGCETGPPVYRCNYKGSTFSSVI